MVEVWIIFNWARSPGHSQKRPYGEGLWCPEIADLLISGPGKSRRAHEVDPSDCLRSSPTICILRSAVPLENTNPGMACGTLLIRRAVAGPKITILTALE